MTKKNAVVVGGGLAGLASAILLSRNGRSVTLLEKAGALGGRARSDAIAGYILNRGPHALYTGGSGVKLLSELGVKIAGKKPPQRGGIALYGGQKYLYPSGPIPLMFTGLLDGEGKREAMKILPGLAKIQTQSLQGTPLADWLAATTKHAVLRDLLESYIRLTTYAQAPKEQSAGAAIRALQVSLASPTLYVDGGWESIVQQLRDIAARAGVDVRTGEAASRVHVDGGRVAGVETATTTHAATDVIVTGAPSDFVGLLGAENVGRFATFAREAIPVRISTLDVALKALPDKRALLALGIDKPTYCVVHSTSAKLAPPGGAVLHVARYLGPGETAARDGRAALESLLDEVQPGWRARLLHARYLPEITVSNALERAATSGTLGRPEPIVPEVRGLFVAGDWVGRQGFLADASLASAQAAATLVTKPAQ